MPADLLNVLLATAPPLVVLILMVGFRWGGSKAGPAGWLVALVIAVLRFGAGGEVLLWSHVRALVLTIDVVFIVWAALGLYFVVREAGALEVIAAWFTALTTDDVLRVLLLGWVFTSFLQGVGGFGVPIAVVAPLLVGLGLPPLTAVVVPALGHAWAVTFGSLGSSFIALVGVTGQDPDLLTPPTAILLGVGALACGTVAAYAYGGGRGLRRALPAILTIGTVMAVVQYVVATNGLWNIGSATAGLAGLAAGLWVTRWQLYRQARPEAIAVAVSASDAPANPGTAADSTRPIPTFPQAISGYVILVVLAVLITGVQPIKQFLGQIKPSVHVPEVATSLGWVTPETPKLGIPILAHTGSVLLYSAVIAFFLFKSRGYYRDGAARTILKGVRQKGVNPAIGILTMVAMATVMQNTGMTRAIAEWLAQAVPPGLYAFVATIIGSLGAFMTGSNTNSNAVFAGLQMDAAVLMGLSVPMVLGIQTASAAIASLLAPAKILVGASTVGISGDEGLVLRNLLLYGGLLLLIIAGLGFVLLQLGY
jgi:lactate permease